MPESIESVIDVLREIDSLKQSIKYLKKKSEIAPLVAMYNHISGHNQEGEIIIPYIKFFIKGGKEFSFSKESIMLQNDCIFKSTGRGLNKQCSIDEIESVELDNFVYTFDD